MTTDPKPVQPTGEPGVDALIDALVCPTCRTIYNAAKAECADLWHFDNRPCAGCSAAATGLDRLEYRHKADCPQFDAFYDASDEDLAEMVPPAPAEALPAEPHEPLADYIEAAERAAYERGKAEGRRLAAAAIRSADTSVWPGGRQSDVNACQEAAATLAETGGSDAA